MINLSDCIKFVDKVCIMLEDKHKILNAMTELSAIFGSELMEKVFFLLKPENADFFAITSEEGHKNIFLYGLSEYFGDYEEYYYFKSSILCFCKTTEISFYQKEIPICHHYIALKIADKLGRIKKGKLSIATILQCMKNRASSVATQPCLNNLSS